jgi:hypothetical protein
VRAAVTFALVSGWVAVIAPEATSTRTSFPLTVDVPMSPDTCVTVLFMGVNVSALVTSAELSEIHPQALAALDFAN